MSRLTKYLKQTAIFKSAKRDLKGDVVLDSYGEPQYNTERLVRCRRERYEQKNVDGLGATIAYTSIYYLDMTVTPRVDDRIDGQLIQNVNDYTDGAGTIVGFEVNV